MKNYYVLPAPRHGFWIVCCSDRGHYRDVAKYHSRSAAENAAEAFNNQTTSCAA